MNSGTYVVFVMGFTLTTVLAKQEASSVGKLKHGMSGKGDNPWNRRKNIILNSPCKLIPTNHTLHERVRELVDIKKITRLEYRLTFANYSSNPLKFANATPHPTKWLRVTTREGRNGQNLLNLAFNYGVISIVTLVSGHKTMDVNLEDRPVGCLGAANVSEQILSLLDLLMRDLNVNGSIAFGNDTRVCRETATENKGYAEFGYDCFTVDSKNRINGDNLKSDWLEILFQMLIAIKSLLILFSPCLFASLVIGFSTISMEYVVPLQEPLKKWIGFATDEQNLKPGELSLTDVKGISSENVQSLNVKHSDKGNRNNVFAVLFKNYNILVDHGRLQTKHELSVSLWRSILDLLLTCKIKNIVPFSLTACCYSDTKICRIWYPWIWLMRKIGRILLILVFFPMPFFIRLIIYYRWENTAVAARKTFIAQNGLKEKYENNLLQYLHPMHPLFISFYISYLVSIVSLAAGRNKVRKFMAKVLFDSFRDLSNKSLSTTITYVASNFIMRPFRRCGVIGCLLCPLNFVVFFPISVFICAIYCLPLLYLISSYIFNCRRAMIRGVKQQRPLSSNKASLQTYQRSKSQVTKPKRSEKFVDELDELLWFVEEESKSKVKDDYLNKTATVEIDCDNLDDETDIEADEDKTKDERYQLESVDRWLCILLTGILIYSTIGVAVITSEVVGCLVEVFVLLMAGIMTNVKVMNNYVPLGVLTIIYCLDCFRNIDRIYLSLNKAIFEEVSQQMKDTFEKNDNKENRGFKIHSDPARPSADVLVKHPESHWLVGELVLFVDKRGTPRIPKKLFDKICKMRVPGFPGPVYRGQFEAIKQLGKILVFLCFIFVIVMAFSEICDVSSGNRMIATVLGGLLPFLLKNFLFPPVPDLDLNSLCFKKRLNEKISRFRQRWPIHELPFQLLEKETRPANDEPAALMWFPSDPNRNMQWKKTFE